MLSIRISLIISNVIIGVLNEEYKIINETLVVLLEKEEQLLKANNNETDHHLINEAQAMNYSTLFSPSMETREVVNKIFAEIFTMIKVQIALQYKEELLILWSYNCSIFNNNYSTKIFFFLFNSHIQNIRYKSRFLMLDI